VQSSSSSSSSRPSSSRSPGARRPAGGAPAGGAPAGGAPAGGAPAAPAPQVTGVQLATAFDGALERRRVSLGYRFGLLPVAVAMVLLPVVYLGIIAAAVWLVGYHVRHSTVIFSYVRGRAALLAVVIYVAPIIAGAMLVLFMILPLFWRSKRGPRPLWVSRKEEPLLYAYVDKLCDVTRAPRPHRIDVEAAANASAHIDNGVFGLVRRRLVLTIGLPLARSMDLRRFTGVIAHELGHFTQGSSMRLHYVIQHINAWFARAAWGQSGIDDVLDDWLDTSDGHWSFALVGLLCKLVLGVARLILKALALVSHALSMNLSRQAEFDADRQAARIAGADAMGDALQQVPYLSIAGDLAVGRAQVGWQRRQLPDDLVLLTHALHDNLPAEAKDSITAGILTSEASWFDTHPPLYKRVAALKKSKLQGVLKLNAPATCLFSDFEELSKLATLDTYYSVLGEKLQPEYLVETIAQPPKAVPSSPAV
jgi:Zn-dependent protease with chaperone function